MNLSFDLFIDRADADSCSSLGTRRRPKEPCLLVQYYSLSLTSSGMSEYKNDDSRAIRDRFRPNVNSSRSRLAVTILVIVNLDMIFF